MTSDNDNNPTKNIEDTKFYATVVMHEAWDQPVVFLGLTQQEASDKASAYVEEQMKEYWDGEGDIEDWIQDCYDQGYWNVDDAEEVKL